MESLSPTEGGCQFDTFMRRAGITIEPVTAEQAVLAAGLTRSMSRLSLVIKEP